MQATSASPNELRGFASNFLPGLADLAEALKSAKVWRRLAWDDLRLRYKRSVLGPIWITVATAFFVAVMGYLWSALMGRTAEVFIPWFAIGITHWRYITAIVNDSSNAFVKAGGIIKNIPMPLTVHIYRMITYNLLILAHNLLIVIGVMVIFRLPLGFATLLFIPGMLILVATSVSVATLFGTIGARYRDFSHTISLLMTPSFFLTPILWDPAQLEGTRAHLALFNPFAHFLAVVREPLLGRVPTLLNYEVTIACWLGFSVAALVMMSRKKRRIPYWV